MRSAMKNHSVLLLFIIVLGFLFALFQLAPNASTLRDTVSVLLAVFPVVAFLLQYAYDHIDPWRLVLNRWRLFLANPESAWSISVDLEVTDAKAGAGAASKAVKGVPASRLLSSSAGVTVWSISGTTIRVSPESDPDFLGDTSQHVRVEVPDVRRAFRGLEHAIRKELAPVLQHVEDAVRPSHRKYVVRIRFPDGNPYFGLFVARLAPEAVGRFDIEWFETDATDRDVVHVKRDRIELVTSTLRSAEALSIRYLSLQPIPRS